MSASARWIVVAMAVAARRRPARRVARGDEHHRGDEVGVAQVAARAPVPSARRTGASMADVGPPTPARARGARLHAPVGVHHPVRADRADGDRDLDRPGRHLRRSTRTGAPIPGTYHAVDSHPARILVDSLTAPINGLYGIEDAQGQHQLLQLRHPLRRDRRRAVHHRHRRLPRRHHADRSDPGRDRPAGRAAARSRALDDPDPDDGLRARRDDVRHGRGEPGVLRARHRGDDRGGVRRPDRCRRRPPRLRHRDLRLDDQPVRHRHRVGLRRRVDQRRPACCAWSMLVVGLASASSSCSGTPTGSRPTRPGRSSPTCARTTMRHFSVGRGRGRGGR